MKKNNSESQKKRIEKYKIQIKELKQKILDMEKNHLLFALEATERAAFEYDMILNPHPQKIKAARGSISEEYEIKSAEVICILSVLRTKKIYTLRPISNEKDRFVKKREIWLNQSVEKTMNAPDSLGHFLMMCYRGTVVNVAHYELSGDELVLRYKNYPIDECKRIPISEQYIEEFKTKQKDLMRII